MSAYVYPIALAALSVLVFSLERAFPWRADQKAFPRSWPSDLLHLLTNGHVLGVILYGVAIHHLLPVIDRALGSLGWTEVVHRNLAADWPLWAQILVALVFIDFLQWCVHVLLHRVPFLWEIHKTHHSVVDGEMSWIVAFRFQWAEVVVYRSLLYLPLAYLGFGGVAVLTHAILGTLIGHLNHANLPWGYGPLRYVLNNPRMHIWHHDYEGDRRTTKNFGIIFSVWDWLFGTASMPDEPPARIGFRGDDEFPRDFFAHQVWPLSRFIPRAAARPVTTAAAIGLLGMGWWAHLAPAAASSQSLDVMGGEPTASSQPAAGGFDYADTVAEAASALGRFGEEARRAGYARPDWMVSVDELASALGAERLVVIDVRPAEDFRLGHVPSAQRVGRDDYSRSEPVPGSSRPPHELQALLRRMGVSAGSEVVLYGDGPEAHRLWWTLHVAGFDGRVLDGGFAAWKDAKHVVAQGDGRTVSVGDVTLGAAPRALGSATRWHDVSRWIDEHPEAILIDARTEDEYEGARVHPSAARGGHIPGAIHQPWTALLRDRERDHRLQPPEELRRTLGGVGIDGQTPAVTYCQSGTRSSVTWFAVVQAGLDGAGLLNYDGSWAEYSRLASEPSATRDGS